MQAQHVMLSSVFTAVPRSKDVGPELLQLPYPAAVRIDGDVTTLQLLMH